MNRIELALAIIFLFAMDIQAVHKGRVFVDKNGNGIFDKGEKVLKDVAVSDGFHVECTNADGIYSLAGHEKERFIYITTPSGYRTNNKYYKRISGNESSYDFALQENRGRIKKDGSHKFVHISDTEISDVESQQNWAETIRKYCANEKSAFIIQTGDICYEKGLKSHINLMNTENMDCPTFYCIGNHDLVKGAYGEELFESLYGPVYYSFDMGNVHYIVTPMLGGDYAPEYKKEDVYRWMKNDLAKVNKNKSVVVFNHDLLTDNEDFIYGINEKEYINLNEHNLKAWIFGHWHINYIQKKKGVLTVSTATLNKGGIDHSTSAFRVMHVDGRGNLSSELRYTYLDKSIQVASIANDHAPVLSNGSVPLSVNVYSSDSPVQKVSYSCFVNGKEIIPSVPMKRQTDWNWYGELSCSKLHPSDKVSVRVKAIYSNGDESTKEASFTYTGKAEAKVALDKDWNNLLGNPSHAGVLKDTLQTPLKQAWVKNIGANIFMTSPIVYQGKVFVASLDENYKKEGAVFALDGVTGSLLWRCQVRNSIKNTIVAGDQLVFAQDAEGYLYGINAADGKICWEKKLDVKNMPALVEGIVYSEGVVFAGTGKGLCAVEAKSGKTLWTNQSWDNAEGASSTWTVGNKVLICGTQWGALYANESETGKFLWSVKANGLRFRGASPAIHGNVAYVISEKNIFILDVQTGKTLFRKELPMSVDVTSTPLLTDKEIIFGSVSEGLIALDNETFNIKWTYKTDPALVYTTPYIFYPASAVETSPVLAGNTIFFGASDGALYGVDKDNGALIWKHTTGAPVFGSVAISGNTLFAVDYSGNVYAFTSNR